MVHEVNWVPLIVLNLALAVAFSAKCTLVVWLSDENQREIDAIPAAAHML